MVSGFFLGGLGESLQSSFNQQQNVDLQQQQLKLQAQSQQNAQKRFDIARNDKLAADLWNSIETTIDHARVAGHSEKEIMPAVQGLFDQYRKFTTSMGQPGMAETKLASLWARPPSTEVQAAMTRAGSTPKVERLTDASGDQRVVVVDPFNPQKGATEVTGTGARQDLSGLEGTDLRDALAKRSGLTPESLDVNASALNSGNTSVLTNLGRGRQGGEAVKAIRAWASYKLIHEEGLSPTEAAERINANTAEYRANLAGASALGRREAQVIGAATTAEQTASRVIEASNLVDRTQYPSLNRIILAAREGTGDENVVRLGIAVNTFVNNYARALGAGNAAITDSARREAFENLNKAWSQGQVKTAIDQMLNKELPSEIAGAKMGLREFLDKKRREQREGGGGTVTKRHKFNPETGELE